MKARKEMAECKGRGVVAVAAVFLALVAAMGVEGQEQHVVGGDRGWDTSNYIPQWSSGRVFRVGDIIWFTYSAAQDNIVELGSLEEYESCDLSNPIRMYTDGLDKISLDGEGIRYFASGNVHNCKNGLKLPVNVLPRHANLAHEELMDGAYAPTPALAPSPYSIAEAPFIGPASQEINPAQPLSTARWGSGIPFNVMMVGEKKWAQRVLQDEAHGPTSASAPADLSGLFCLLAVGLALHAIG